MPPTIGVALAPGFEALLVCRTLQGLCMPGLLAVGAPYIVEAFVPRIGARAMGYYVSALVAGGLVGRLGVALASAVVGWRVAIGVLAFLPLAAAIAMRRGLPEPELPPRGGGWKRHLTNLRLLGVSVGGAALFFTFVGTFTYITYRLEEPPFSLLARGREPRLPALADGPRSARWRAGSPIGSAGAASRSAPSRSRPPGSC